MKGTRGSHACGDLKWFGPVLLMMAVAWDRADAVRLVSGHRLVDQNSSFAAAVALYSTRWADNVVAATQETLHAARNAGYQIVGDNGNFYVATEPAPTGTVPLVTYYSEAMADYLTTAADQGHAWAMDLKHGYIRLRTEGYCRLGSPPAGPSALSAFVYTTYWSVERNDTFLVLVGSENEMNARAAHYVQMWDECWVEIPQIWTSWPDAGPAKNIPWPKSKDILDWQYLQGANANYGGADTWYPSWASNGNMYSSFTDGMVTIVGPDPFNLSITEVHTFESSSFPYESRYPCGQLVHNGVWYYGSYYLNNPNSTTPQGDFVGPNPGPNCGNWCVQGPLADFRYSLDFGKTWTEPRMKATGPTDNLFGESAIHNSKVKFGAPHFVDFGQDMQHSPDGKAYIVGHGAARPEAIQAWMLGDQVYLARVVPTPANIVNRSAWEYYAGGIGEDAVWIAGNISMARPLISWENHTGVVTMSYHAALNKYIMVVSTATDYPSMVGPFDTYFLEASDMTGPWSYITYLESFGPEAYFVHFPTKFLEDTVNTSAPTPFYNAFLSYSANFAYHQSPPSPPRSGYHWSLQQSRFTLSSAFAPDFIHV